MPWILVQLDGRDVRAHIETTGRQELQFVRIQTPLYKYPKKK